MDRFAGKVAVVTGAASGIGLACARLFAAQGMAVALLDVRADELTAASTDLAAYGARVLPVVVDVGDAAAVDAAAVQVLAKLGRVHVLMNNAAVFVRGHGVTDVDDALWEWLLRVNLYGPIHCIRSFLPGMRSHGEGGHIISTASISGLTVADRKNGLYATSKFALIGLSEALAHDLVGSNVDVSVLIPAGVASEFYEHSAQLRGSLGGPNLFPTTPPETAADMKPEEIAARLLDGMKRRQFYIPTHVRTRVSVEERHRALMAGFDAAAAFRNDAG